MHKDLAGCIGTHVYALEPWRDIRKNAGDRGKGCRDRGKINVKFLVFPEKCARKAALNLTGEYRNVILIGCPAWRGFFKVAFLRPADRHEYGRKEKITQMRVKVTLACADCKQRNYFTMKNRKNDPDRLTMKKYCRFCKKHTEHRETR